MLNAGRPLKTGNYDGHRLGFDYRKANIAGTYNLYRNNKFVKQVGLEWWDKRKEVHHGKG